MTRKPPKISLLTGTKRPDFSLISDESRKFQRLFDNAMYFIHYEYPHKRLKSETLKYAKKNHLNYTPLDKLDNYYFAVVGKPCVIINNGGNVPNEWREFLRDDLDRLIDLGSTIVDEVTDSPKKKVSIQDYIHDRAGNIAGMLEEWIDSYMINPSAFKKKSMEPLVLLRNEDTKPAHARVIATMFSPCVEEMALLVDGKDKELVDAYSHITKAQRKHLLSMYSSFVDAAQVIVKEAAATKIRNKKPIPAGKLVSKLKYLPEFTDLKITSIPSVEIIGAKVLWVYNTKTRKIGKYVAIDESGLTVKGTTIVNYSEKDSVEKTLRKPIEKIAEFKKAKVTALKTFLEDLSTVDIKLKGRLNEHCVLLKVQ